MEQLSLSPSANNTAGFNLYDNNEMEGKKCVCGKQNI